jgi:hypothetical protein
MFQKPKGSAATLSAGVQQQQQRGGCTSALLSCCRCLLKESDAMLTSSQQLCMAAVSSGVPAQTCVQGKEELLELLQMLKESYITSPNPSLENSPKISPPKKTFLLRQIGARHRNKCVSVLLLSHGACIFVSLVCAGQGGPDGSASNAERE